MALAVLAETALARSYLNCLTKKVVIVDAPRGSASSSIEENLGFWIDEAAKTLVLADGTPLAVRRFDDRWISATRGDMSYEFDRQNGNLMYASSTTKEGSATHNRVRPMQNSSWSSRISRSPRPQYAPFRYLLRDADHGIRPEALLRWYRAGFRQYWRWIVMVFSTDGNHRYSWTRNK